MPNKSEGFFLLLHAKLLKMTIFFLPPWKSRSQNLSPSPVIGMTTTGAIPLWITNRMVAPPAMIIPISGPILMGAGGSSFWLVPGASPGASSWASGVSTRTLGLWLVWSIGVGIGAHLSRAFGVAPKFAASATSGFGFRPRVLVATSNVRALFILLIVI